MSIIQSCFNLVRSSNGEYKSEAQKKFIKNSIVNDSIKYRDRVGMDWKFVFDESGIILLYKNDTLAWYRGEEFIKKGQVKPITQYTEEQIIDRFNKDFRNMFGIDLNIVSILQMRSILNEERITELSSEVLSKLSVINLTQHQFLLRYKEFCKQKYVK